jgi:hypothetical protein
MVVPNPPDLTKREPLVEIWRAGEPLHRVHRAGYEPTAFSREAHRGRFRPFRSGSRIVPTLYAAHGVGAALAETVFHDIDPEAEDQIVLRSKLYGQVRSLIVPQRDLRLVSLRGSGLRRLRTSARALIHTGSSDYPATAAFAAALYRWRGRADGLIWDSRLHPGAGALILFGTRLRAGTLTYSYDSVEPLWKGTGFDEVLVAAEQAGITIVI